MIRRIMTGMAVALAAIPAMAVDFTYRYEGKALVYTVLDEEAKTCCTRAGSDNEAGNAASGDVIIPSVVKNGEVEYKVVEIAYGSFKNCGNLNSVVIPNTVESIGRYAFYWCSSLADVEFGNSVKTIDENAFADCDGLKSLTLPSSLETIAKNAFHSCGGLTDVILPPAVKTVALDSFSDCMIKKMAYPEGLDRTPNRVTYAVAYNPEGVVIDGGYVYGPGKKALLFVPSTVEGDYTVPAGVTSIGNSAFIGCMGITSMKVPDAVTSIGTNAFYACQGLGSITLPEGLTSISPGMLQECRALENVNIPSGVKEIGSGAFNLCHALKSIDLPYGLEKIGNEAFNSCISLEKMVVPNTVTSIGQWAFNRCLKLQSITLPGGIESIGWHTFYTCEALTEIVLPPSVKTVSEEVFMGCPLVKVVMGPNVESIGKDSFDGGSGLNVYITAQTPPEAPNSTFRDYMGNLYVQGQKALDAYGITTSCWYNFDNMEMMTVAERLEGDTKPVSGKPGDKIQLSARVVPADAALPQVFWRTSDPEAATVDHDGLVTIHSTEPCKIIAESLYAGVAPLETPVNGWGGIDEITGSETEGIDYSRPYEVYDLQGVRLGTAIDTLAPGIYILRQGSRTEKVWI